MSFIDYLFLFSGMGLVTYLPRWLPLFYLAHRRLPQGLIDWLSMIPVAILSALLAPSLFSDAHPRCLHWGKLELLVAIPTLFFSLKSRSMGATVLLGMFLYWLGGLFL
jgi:branched-subunit amino acid transport protein